MRTIIIGLGITLFFLFSSMPGFAQCSDAGACQLGHFVNENDGENFKLSLTYKNAYSGKDDDVSFHSFHLTAHYDLFKGSTVSMLFPYNIQSGPVSSVDGIGDLILGWSQKLIEDETSSLTASLGIKLATGDENKESSLSQIYQPGLGSNDLIFTIDYSYERFSIGAGYQLAGGRNDNEVIRLKRGDDLIIRTSYFFPFDGFTLLPQLLLIKRLSKSSILDQNSLSENFIDVDKSDPVQINLQVELQYPLNEDFALFTEAAVPFLKREVNVDGLTRAYTISAGLRVVVN